MESDLISVTQPEAHSASLLSMAEPHTLTSDWQNDAHDLAARSTVVVPPVLLPPVLGRPPVTAGVPPVEARPPVVFVRPPLALPPELEFDHPPTGSGFAPPGGSSKIGSPTERPPQATTHATLSHTALTTSGYAAARR